MGFGKVQGYCLPCGHPVEIRWERPLPPQPLASFWDPLFGATREVYPCPVCEKPFVAIREIEEFICCPRCTQPTLKYKALSID